MKLWFETAAGLESNTSKSILVWWHVHTLHEASGIVAGCLLQPSSEGAVDSGIGWWRYKKPMISRCSSYAAADDCWASGTDYDAAAPLPILVWSEKPYFLLQNYLGFLFCKKIKYIAPKWHEIPTRAIYWYLWKPYSCAACFTLSFVKLFATLMRFFSCF